MNSITWLVVFSIGTWSSVATAAASDLLIVPPVSTAAGDRTLAIATLLIGIVSAILLGFVAIRDARK